MSMLLPLIKGPCKDLPLIGKEASMGFDGEIISYREFLMLKKLLAENRDACRGVQSQNEDVEGGEGQVEGSEGGRACLTFAAKSI